MAVPRQNDDQPLNQQLARAVTLLNTEAQYSQSFGEAQRQIPSLADDRDDRDQDHHRPESAFLLRLLQHEGNVYAVAVTA
jgi:hypothetical protein